MMDLSGKVSLKIWMKQKEWLIAIESQTGHINGEDERRIVEEDEFWSKQK
jgi:hypothetical protein